jgi:hypothetical protein
MDAMALATGVGAGLIIGVAGALVVAYWLHGRALARWQANLRWWQMYASSVATRATAAVPLAPDQQADGEQDNGHG